jgi:transcriptional regulator with XRE-family HTH domain
MDEHFAFLDIGVARRFSAGLTFQRDSQRAPGHAACNLHRHAMAEIKLTVREIAREAGVSIATVSRVLNGGHLVKIETKERVLAALSRSKYSVNLNAAALGRLNAHRARPRLARRISKAPPRDAAAVAHVLDEIEQKTAAVNLLMEEFFHLRRRVEALAQSEDEAGE